MRIEIELPDWTEERTIYIMAGIELVGYKLPQGRWQLKTGRCNMCGKCCMNLKKHAFPLVNGTCIHLQKEPGNNPRYGCSQRINRPFGCCIGVPKNMSECTEKFEEVWQPLI